LLFLKRHHIIPPDREPVWRIFELLDQQFLPELRSEVSLELLISWFLTGRGGEVADLVKE
jgi:hypothetical protein